ncbi:MAG: hypothetical protein ACYCX4_01670 [Bacillota bacterium]
MITGLVVKTDKREYSKYMVRTKDPHGGLNEDNLQVVTAKVGITGGAESDQIQVSLVRLDGYGVVSSKTVSIENGQTNATVTFDLVKDCKDADGINRAKAGDYVVRAVSGNISADSSAFAVSIVSVKEMRQMWCYGMTLYAAEILGPKVQPRLVAGVVIDEVSQGHLKGVYRLVYTLATKALSWNGGTAATVDPALGITQYVLLDKREEDYIIVTVDPDRLPGADKTEPIIIEQGQMSDEAIIEWVRRATGWVESRINLNVEPSLVDTDPDPDNNRWADKQVDTVTYYRPPTFLNWLNIKLPHHSLLKVHELSGYFNTSKVTTITPDWIVFSEKVGLIELVPRQGAVVNWQFYQSTFLQFLYTYGHIPDFWHYRITAGLRDLNNEREIIREAIAKKAAIEIMLAAGSAYRAGYSSESISRDGVSESQSYTSSAIYGIYSSQYENFDKWLKENMKRIKQKFLGISMVTL